MSMNCTVFFPLPVEAPVLLPRPTPRKVSQKERRKKERDVNGRFKKAVKYVQEKSDSSI